MVCRWEEGETQREWVTTGAKEANTLTVYESVKTSQKEKEIFKSKEVHSTFYITIYVVWQYITWTVTGSITLSISDLVPSKMRWPQTHTERSQYLWKQLCGTANPSNEQEGEARQRTSVITDSRIDVPRLPSAREKLDSQTFPPCLHIWHAGHRQLFWIL